MWPGRNIWCDDQVLNDFFLCLSRTLHQALCPIAKGTSECHLPKFSWGPAAYFSDSSYKHLAPAFQTTWHQTNVPLTTIVFFHSHLHGGDASEDIPFSGGQTWAETQQTLHIPLWVTGNWRSMVFACVLTEDV